MVSFGKVTMRPVPKDKHIAFKAARYFVEEFAKNGQHELTPDLLSRLAVFFKSVASLFSKHITIDQLDAIEWHADAGRYDTVDYVVWLDQKINNFRITMRMLKKYGAFMITDQNFQQVMDDEKTQLKQEESVRAEELRKP